MIAESGPSRFSPGPSFKKFAGTFFESSLLSTFTFFSLSRFKIPLGSGLRWIHDRYFQSGDFFFSAYLSEGPNIVEILYPFRFATD